MRNKKDVSLKLCEDRDVSGPDFCLISVGVCHLRITQDLKKVVNFSCELLMGYGAANEL